VRGFENKFVSGGFAAREHGLPVQQAVLLRFRVRVRRFLFEVLFYKFREVVLAQQFVRVE
jgi:hypothetical protein